MTSLSSTIKHYTCSLKWCVKNTWIKCPISCHKTMMCGKDILQLFFEDLNKYMSPLKISYHHISSVTVSSSNRHQVPAGCLLSWHILLGHLEPWRWDQLVTPKRPNIITNLCCVQSQNRVGLEICSISVSPSKRRMPNGGIIMCSVPLL